VGDTAVPAVVAVVAATGSVAELITDRTALVTGLSAPVAAAVEVADGMDPLTAETVAVIGPRAEG
jgi:hypothetical protein